ncbi:uncharacterized protein LOC113219252 isoform X2 [Apis mellifera]|uniref:Uncharacterized protein LOC113219252 isoform X2 n=1 Tax=Apis mellifera TaxID=7460 RepID=A0A7M7MUN7_APIME|nr:uncharacterized protein LOC113219252 isoform X2 [Apis mellifera]|eukprot:XP_026301115.1 uncharacterized protein LOC113219252 isoform X2 [Apis mellifera]
MLRLRVTVRESLSESLSINSLRAVSYEPVAHYSESSYRERKRKMLSPRKEWNKNDTFKLIALYEHQPILWDKKHMDYRNREKKNKILSEIGLHFECSIEEIQRKIHNLRNQMSQELKKKKKRKKGTDEIEESNWIYFNALKFLIPPLTINVTQSLHTQTSMSIKENVFYEENVEMEETTSTSTTSSKKIKREIDDNQLFKTTLSSSYQEVDEYDKFGQYVALELKTLKSDFNKARLKSEIRKIIVQIADEDLYDSINPLSSSISMPSP